MATPVENTIFHRTSVGRMKFAAAMGPEGPTLFRVDRASASSPDSPFGPSQVLILGGQGAFGQNGTERTWTVFRNGHGNPRIVLPGIGREEAVAFAGEFGMTIELDGRRHHAGFADGPAWKSLLRWVEANPALAETFADRQEHLGDWHSKALLHLEHGLQDLPVSPAPRPPRF